MNQIFRSFALAAASGAAFTAAAFACPYSCRTVPVQPVQPRQAVPVQPRQVIPPPKPVPAIISSADVVGLWTFKPGESYDFRPDGSVLFRNGETSVTGKFALTGGNVTMQFGDKTQAGSLAFADPAKKDQLRLNLTQTTVPDTKVGDQLVLQKGAPPAPVPASNGGATAVAAPAPGLPPGPPPAPVNLKK